MLCFIYKSLKKDGIYVFIKKKNDFSAIPDVLLERIGQPVFVMQLELTQGRKLARENAQQVMDQIQKNGFFVQLPPKVTGENLYWQN